MTIHKNGLPEHEKPTSILQGQMWVFYVIAYLFNSYKALQVRQYLVLKNN